MTMPFSFRLRLNWGTAARVAADVLLINLAFAVALSIRFSLIVWSITGSRPGEYGSIFQRFIEVYTSTSWIITGICLIVFALSGFYTYGRNYKGRYKTLVIFQAVSLGYLISGIVLYMLMDAEVREILGITDRPVPRAAFFISWLNTFLLVAGARFWSAIWRKILHRESQQPASSSRQKPEHILVIGGAGYIGSALLRRLLERNYTVRLMDLLLYGEEPIADLVGHPRLELIRADFRQIDRVVQAMQGMDAVVHLGAIVGDPAGALDEKLTIDINMIATRMIAEIARSNDIERFVFASTCSVYGAGEQVLDEHSVLTPVSLYARTKLAAEQMLLGMTSTSPGFAPVILRFGTLYGFSGRARFDLVVNLLTAKALHEGQIPVFGGEQWRPFIHVEDAAHAVLRVVESPSSVVSGEVFNVGSNEQNYQIRTIGEIIQRRVPAAQVIDQGDEADPRDYRVNFDKVGHLLGFAPEWTVEEGIQQVIEAFEQGRIHDYQDKLYSNVRFLTDEGASRLLGHAEDWMSEYLQGSSKENHG